MRRLVPLLLLFGSPLSLSAQKAPLSTDRPTATEASSTVGQGVVQLELGWAWDRSEPSPPGSRVRTLFTPLLLRIGILKDLEFRFSTNGYLWQKVHFEGETPHHREGVGSPVVGMKWHLAPGGSRFTRPSVGLSLAVDLPLGHEAFRPAKAQPRLNLALDFPLQSWTLTQNASWASLFDAERGERFYQSFLGTALSRPVGERSGLFLEVFASCPHQRGGRTSLSFDTGMIFVLGPDWQLDVALVRGITSEASPWGATVGISLRVP